ncbi:AAA family ATPase [Nicoliella spurrieriana]|uniref:AAA family ATPase n=1 Tax=Nicoliella spurrieriana TaxID=2925830 RepID=A0A976RS54_9LACO|nr:AAA family ATPase [Nicoliella spurrieriana]UQS86892.1 AAA family ATPase [Nicoliella spurrieriana]
MAAEAIGTIQDLFVNKNMKDNSIYFTFRLVYQGFLNQADEEKINLSSRKDEYIYLEFKSIHDVGVKINGLNVVKMMRDQKITKSADFDNDIKVNALKEQMIEICRNKLFITEPNLTDRIGYAKLIAVVNADHEANYDQALAFLNPSNTLGIYGVDELLHSIESGQEVRVNEHTTIDENVQINGMIWAGENETMLLSGHVQVQADGVLQFTDPFDQYQVTKINDDWLSNLNDSDTLFYIPENVCLGDSASGTIKQSHQYFNAEYNQAIVNSQSDDVLYHFAEVLAKQYRFEFTKQDIANFHNSVKSFPLTILAGLSGSGKSKIVTAYADALGIKNEEQFNMVAVSPDWQSDADLLGFVDISKERYLPSTSGIVDTLIAANANPHKLYLIVLDEMNLARVEFYFAQFLSVLERDKKDQKIRLYNPHQSVDNADEYPAEVWIPNNVRFIGTMNIDESTFQLSDKVLDRANLIKLSKTAFTAILNLPAPTTVDSPEVSFDTYQQTIDRGDFQFNQLYLQFFDDLYQLINNAIPDLGFSWRTLSNIQTFMSNVKAYDDADFQFDDRVAFDYQIAQRILPKVRGSQQVLAPLLGADNQFEQLLDRYHDLSDFEVTRQQLTHKRKEIRVIGFAN